MSGRLAIVGGGPAGLSAARAYRESGGEGEVVILSSENFPPYRRPPLTKEYLRGELPRDELPIEAPGWYEENEVEPRLGVDVVSLDRERKVVVAEGGEEFPYDVCVLATGSEPARPPIPGMEDPGVHVMRTVEDSEGVSDKVEEGKSILVVGSGFIGCEAAASLSMRGARVAVVSMEEAPQKERLGPEVGEYISSWLEEGGVELRLGMPIEEITRGGEGFEAVLEGGEKLRADEILLGAGVEARVGLARNSGLEIESGGVVCDSSMRSSDPRVSACGDISFARNEAAGRSLRVEHWGDALEHGRVAGTVAAGGEASWRSVPGFWSSIGDRTLKYAAWGDGWDESRFVGHGGGAFTVWYGAGGVCVGVLTHDRDEDYEEGRGLVESKAPFPG